jgi:hypothetical protein
MANVHVHHCSEEPKVEDLEPFPGVQRKAKNRRGGRGALK